MQSLWAILTLPRLGKGAALCAVLVLCMCFFGGAVAQERDGPNAGAAQPSSTKSDSRGVAQRPGGEVVCKKTAETGSRVRDKKTCRTKDQWDALEKETQQSIKTYQNDSTQVRTGTGGS
jgi:hypothetical protein